MPDNLTVTIGADTSKLQADIKFTTAQIQQLGREINAAFKAGDVSTARALSDTVGTLKTNLTGMNQELAKTAPAFNNASRSADGFNQNLKEVVHSGRGLGRVVSEFNNLSRGVESASGILGNLVGGFTGGLFGVAVTRGFDALMASIDAVGQRLTAVRDLARDTGAKPLVVQGMQELAKESGESADSANKFLTTLSGTLTKVATQTRDVQTGLASGAKAATDAQRNFATFGDTVVQVNRGGVAVTRDFSDALAILQINEGRLIKLPLEQQMQMVSQAFLRVEQNAKRLGLTETQLNAISKDVFGVPTEAADKLAKAYLNIGQKAAELATAQRGATAENIKAVDEEAAAREKVSQKIQDATAAAANSTSQFRLDTIKSFGDLAEAIPKLFEHFPEIWEKAFTAPRGTLADPTFQPFEPLKGDAAELPGFMTPIVQSLADIWNRFWKGLSISANAAELDVKTAATGMATALQGVDATLKDVTVSAAATGALPYVGRGPGAGTYAGYGPVPGGTAGYGIPGQAFGESAGQQGSRLQSNVPGISSYQELPSKAVYPMAESTAKNWSSAAQSASDLAAATQSAADAAAKVTSAWVDQPFTTYAAGGPIRGAGNGTSDSILARVSNGEYVMRERAVEYWGPSFMDAINSMRGFSGGGLVRPVPSFAGGGLVTTGGGATVNLHFPGGSFEMRGDKAIVAGLTREARRAGMLNAGRMPGALA